MQSLQLPKEKLLGIPEVIFWMFRKSSSGILEVDVISRVFRKLSPGYFGKYFLGMFRNVFPGMFRNVFPGMFFLECSGMYSPVCSGSVLLFATKSIVTGIRVLRGRFRCAMVRFFATRYKIANETLTSWQRRKFCSVFYKKQTNFLLGIMLPDVCKAVSSNYPLKFSFNGYLFETLWS